MLHEFITAHRDAIVTRTRQKLTDRHGPPVSASEIEDGLPLFLSQLSETLRRETTPTPFSRDALCASAVKDGRESRPLGFDISHVVHDYGDIRQAICEVAVEHHVPITTGEFQALNRCFDAAIAEAVTEHARISSEARSREELERSGQLAHEIRDILNTALLTFRALKLGTADANASTGTVLGRSLMNLRDLVDKALSDVRMAASIQRTERVAVAAFLGDLAVVANLHAESRALQFALERVNPRLAVNADPQLLASAVMNLLNNAFKYTRAGGCVVLRALCDGGRVRIEIEDECGGIPDSTVHQFKAFADPRTDERTGLGLGLGLSIARKAARMHGGEIDFRNLPGKGCVFAIEMRSAGEGTPVLDSAV